MSIPLVTLLGRMTLAFLEAIGSVSSFALQAIRCALQPPWYRQQILRQMLEIGYYSLPVVGLTAIFTGMVLALQSYTGFARFSAEIGHPQRRRRVADTRAGSGAGRRSWWRAASVRRWRPRSAPCASPSRSMR